MKNSYLLFYFLNYMVFNEIIHVKKHFFFFFFFNTYFILLTIPSTLDNIYISKKNIFRTVVNLMEFNESSLDLGWTFGSTDSSFWIQCLFYLMADCRQACNVTFKWI